MLKERFIVDNIVTKKTIEPVWIVTLNWNGLAHLKYFLKSAIDVEYSNINILVVDNASSDSSVSFIKENYPNVKVIENDKNYGYSVGFNIGIEFAIQNGAEYLFLTNNDLFMKKSIIYESLKTMNSDSRIGYVGGKIFNLHNHKLLQYAGGRVGNVYNGYNRGKDEYDNGQYDKVEFFDYMDDVCGLVNVKMIKEIGAFDSDFFYDFEETEWNYRMRNAGWKIAYCPKMMVWHRLHGSTGGHKFSKIPEFNHIRGKILFLFKTNKKKELFLLLMNHLFFGLLKRKIILIKHRQTKLFYYHLGGIISAFKRIVSIKNGTK